MIFDIHAGVLGGYSMGNVKNYLVFIYALMTCAFIYLIAHAYQCKLIWIIMSYATYF